MIGRFKHLTLPLLLVAGFAVLTGCDDDEFNGDDDEFNGDGDACTEDVECEIDGDICLDGSCVPTCEGQDDCFEGEACAEVDERDDDARICQDFNWQDEFETCDDTDDCGVNETCEDNTFEEGASDICQEIALGQDCDFNEDCRTDEFCDSTQDPEDGDFNGACNDISELAFYTLLIQDETREYGEERASGAAACDDATFGFETAGAKLMYAELIDGEDEVIAYGQLVDVDFGEGAFYGDPDAIFNGEAPDFTGSCPEEQTFPRGDGDGDVTSNMHEDAVYAMGCDGWVGLQFRDEDGNLIVLDDSMSVLIGEFGPSCNDTHQTGNDAFDLYLCQDRRPDELDLSTCEMEPQNDEPASGIFEQRISLPL